LFVKRRVNIELFLKSNSEINGIGVIRLVLNNLLQEAKLQP